LTKAATTFLIERSTRFAPRSTAHDNGS